MATLIQSRGEWATLASGVAGPRGAHALDDPALRHDHAALVEDGVFVEVGPAATLRARHPKAAILDLGDRLVIPGFVDPHTHPVFAATREDEFAMRLQGRSYVEIAQAGGGILNSARRLRSTPPETLVSNLRQNADRFLLLGTTTIEAKSGYGLSTESELTQLRAIREVDRSHPLSLVPTFLGAHEIPEDYKADRESYVRLLCDEMIPRVAAEGLAEACDIFCEEHVFTVAESRRILQAAKDAGLAVKLHADEIRPTGGAELAAEMGALSADHLVAISDAGIEQMRDAGVIPILLPATSFFLNLPHDAPGRKMLERGLAVALATDFNPGSSPTRSMPLVMTMACIKYGMTPAQALGAATWNAAHAIGRGGEVGAIAPGFRADLVALDLPHIASVPYRFGESFVHTVVKDGAVVVSDGRRVDRPAQPAAPLNSPEDRR